MGLLLDGTSGAIAEAAGTLGHLAATAQNERYIVEAGAIPPLEALVRDGCPVTKVTAAAALDNLGVSAAEYS